MNEVFARRRTLALKRGKERVAANRHPWIFAGAIQSERGPEDAAFADLFDSEGTKIASGFYSQTSQIRLRALTFGDEVLDEALIASRITNAIARRRAIFEDGATNCARLVHAEGDDLSSLVVDRYDDVLVVEIANRGVEQIKPLIVDVLMRELQPRAIYFKNDLPLRRTEGLSAENEWRGEAGIAEVLESALRFKVDPAEGQKTGFFLDQRENRRIARTLASGRRVLNLFSYTGGFGVYAAAGGASAVSNVDISARAVDGARENHALNGFEASFTVADAFQYVRQSREQFDFIVCDPPAFAKSRNEVERAARGYKDVNLFAMRMVAPGGSMMTFSCSGHMSLDLFQKVIFAAALDAGRRISFVRRLTAGPDHPTSIHCPEGEYLKGFLLDVH
ncbi:MAG TPA: class I SAM-dependent rRNA methyltransferase [Thermoanaerobaculia bacterium]|nr:class I SAM-dependent rRNA methyltransferase [Thermoanaerobaculia bacterium]